MTKRPPNKGSYKYGQWLFDVRLSEIGAKLEGKGLDWAQVKKHPEFADCKYEAMSLMYRKHPKKTALPLRHFREFYYWFMMQKRLKEVQEADQSDLGRMRYLWKSAFHYYERLEQEQIERDGSVHPMLLPPGLSLTAAQSTQTDTPETGDFGAQVNMKRAETVNKEIQTGETRNAEVQTCDGVSRAAGPSHTEINLGYVRFQLPLERDLAPLELPFSIYRPEDFIRDYLRDGGLDLYKTRLRARLGGKMGALQYTRMGTKAKNLMQEALNCIAKAQNNDAYCSYVVSESKVQQGRLLLKGLHRRICMSMPKLVAPRHIPQPLHKQPVPNIFSEESSELDLMALNPEDFALEEHVQNADSSHLALRRLRKTVGMTRDVFSEMEKGLFLESRNNPSKLTRCPKKKILSRNFVKYTIYSLDIVRRFFKQAIYDKSLNELFVAKRGTKRLEAVVSSQYPCYIRHQGAQGTTMSVDICFG